MKKVRLLKNVKVKDGKTYHNLFVQLDNGSPIAIDLVHFNAKVKCLLLANAYDFETSTITQVKEDDQD